MEGACNVLKRMSEYNFFSGIRLRIYPSYQQKKLIKKNADAARFVYNEMVACSKEISGFGSLTIYIKGISERIEALRERMTSVTALKSHFLWLNDKAFDANMIANAKKNYAHAWQCYRNGETKSPPTFHRKTYAQSYQTNPHYNRQRISEATLTNGSAGFRDKTHVYLPKLGMIRCRGSRKIIDKLFAMQLVRIGTMTITRDTCGDYFLSMQLASDNPFVDSLPKKNSAVGIDLNIKNLYTDSNGNVISNPFYMKRKSTQLIQAQRVLSGKERACKKRGILLYNGKNYQKQRLKVAKMRRLLKRQRLDFLNVQSMNLLKNHDKIFVEHLDVNKLIHKADNAREIYEVGWRMFLNILERKAKLYGRTFIEVNPAYTTQRCSVCGFVLPKGKRLRLSVRQWICPHCHTMHDRDKNAACNILQFGQQKLNS